MDWFELQAYFTGILCMLMTMIGRIDPVAPLDYVELQIFPSQNRYEGFVCSNKRAEMVASGALERLLLHSPRVKDMFSKGSNTNFKILPPDNVNDAEWFTTATFTRFLHIIGSRDILGIGNEITQLEETRRFQLSLSGKAEVNITSSVNSKNELLRAVDLRLTALVATFNQATSGRCSIKDVSDLENFAHHFGAKDIRDSLQKLVEMNLFLTVEDINNTERNDTAPKPSQWDPSIKDIVSPAIVVQSELQNSSDDEISSFSSKEDQLSVERSRAPTRSSTPRRSASPMPRIQIGRSGSRKAAALTIKSLNHFSVREKVLFPRDQASNSSDEDGPEKPAKQSVLRMSVQDKISLFESKQRDQKMDVPKTKTLLNKTIGAKKTVLRRWSSGMGEIATQNPDTNPETSPICPKNVAPEPESDTTIFESQVSAETEENIKPHYSPERRTLEPLGVNVDTLEPEREEFFEKHPASIEWNQQREAEMNQLLVEMMENKPVSNGKNFSKQTRDEKLHGKTVGKRAEKVEQFKLMQPSVDERNIEMVSTDESDANRKQKIQKSNPLSNSRREASKPSVLKKAISKTSPLPATRKSWSSTPSPRPTGASPASNQTGPTPASTKPTSRKAKSASSTVGSTTKSEKSQPRTKTLKATPPDANRILKTITEKNQSTVTKITKATKAKIRSPEVNDAAAKPSYCNKVTKKSSVVPLETKPFLRKGSGFGPGVGQVIIKTKVFGQPEETSRISETLTQTEENEVVMTTEISEDLEECEATESQVVCPSKCEELTNTSCNDSLKPEINTETEEELTISPTAWVEAEIEDQSDNHEEEVILWKEKESPVQIVSPVKVVAPAGTSSPRVRRSLCQMLLEDSSEEADIGEWGNAENLPALVYQKNSPKGLKKLLKFARKTKPDFHPTRWSSASVFLESDDGEVFKGQQNISEFTYQSHPKVPEVPASMNATKATRSSLFSLSTFRGSKTNESKLP